MKNRTRVAESRLIMWISGREVLQNADQAPCQYQAHPDNHQHGDHDSHGTSPKLNWGNFMIPEFSGL
jgi:hypothetical protein